MQASTSANAPNSVSRRASSRSRPAKSAICSRWVRMPTIGVDGATSATARRSADSS
jgi:hypothetical protein